MKFIKYFKTEQESQLILSTWQFDTISAILGIRGAKFSKRIEPTPGPDYSIPFYIEDISGESNTVSIKKSNNSAPTLTIEKSTDGENWTSMGSTSLTAITAVVPANGKLYLRCNTTSWTNRSGSDVYSHRINVKANSNVGGNIMSLLYGSSFNGQTEFPPEVGTLVFVGLFTEDTHIINADNLLLPATILTDKCYQSMFANCTSLTTAPELPATTLANNCYVSMFYGCTSLTTAPALPATTLANYCYRNMFTGCISLTTAPALPATTLANSCYQSMFSNCTSLTTAPAILPATTLVTDCYSGMFADCSALTTAPALPATTLANSCYNQMFKNCTSLTTAPKLPATALVTYCYQNMFYGCTNLNNINCLATNISASYCTRNWVNGVASTGIFVKNENMTSWTTGVNGIPSGWVIKNPSGIELTQNLNVATIEVTDLDEGTGYYTINGGSHISVGNGTTTIPITQGMNGQVLLVHGEFSGEPSEETLTLSWTDYSPSVTITEANNYVTITSATADTVQYRLGSSGEYSTYTEPVYINANTTIYVQATKTVSGIDYTTNASQEVTHEPILPTNLAISCTNNFVSITATNATTIEYNTDGSSSYTIYTAPFAISQTVTVYAKAINSDGEITASQQCTYVDYAPPVSISESNNYVTITSATADTIQYRLGSSGEYTTYTEPVYIAEDTTIYVQATRTVAGVDYTSTASQAVTHEVIPPTNLVIGCTNNTVTITADNATTVEYNTNGSSTYTTYASPFAITETVTVYARATNADGSITASQECEYQSSSVPFAENLIFYAPLTEGDLADHISGENAIIPNNITVTWDSAKGMYSIYNSVGGTRFNGLNWNLHWNYTGSFTIFAHVEVQSESGNGYFGYVIVDRPNNDMYSLHKARNGDNGDLVVTLDSTASSNRIKFYNNGTQKVQANWPVEVINKPYVMSGNSNTTNCRAYIKDVRVYNRTFTAAEIAQLSL